MELALGAVLLGLLYDKPHALTDFANSILGKAIMIVIVGLIAKMRGIAAGLLAALIFITLMHENIELMTNNDSVNVVPNKVAQQAIDSKLPGKKCSNDAECGVATTKCQDGQCTVQVQPEPELEAVNKANEESFDVRTTEGFRSREAYQNTIEAMKFSNGQTGAGQNRYNQF